MTIFPLFKASGEIDYVAATYKDETQVTLANERLRLSEERLRLAQQAARVGTFEVNVQTGVNIWTPALEAMHGLEPGEFGRTQESWERLLHPEDRALARTRVNQALESFLPVECEWRVVWPDGSVHWIFARFQVTKDDTGKPHRVIGANLDITERKQAEVSRERAEEALRQTEEQLRQSQKMEAIGRSAGGVAHDFNNLLSVILSYASCCSTTCTPSDPMRADVEEIASAGERAASSPASCSRSAASRCCSPKSLDLNEVVGGHGEMLRRLIGEDIELSASTGADPGQGARRSRADRAGAS